MSRLHWLKNQQFESNLSKITRLFAAIESLRFALLFIMQFDDTSGAEIKLLQEN